ncbi:MAG: 1-(5-phosphoribosyl)-5-[Clostridia bacterium]|nr:1-(5-phosphoribosyl)-5-[(5-phosphoribosylamino)methylideneamino]imidazole-4-carboxamide isomerase [Clostridia bacterium]
MILLPAIDLYEHKAVRLYKGDYAQMTVYSDDPASVSKAFQSAGAAWIHVVDLEGARYGTTPHLDLISQIKSETGLKIEVGGGIRTLQALENYMSAGVDRAIIGTAAVFDRAFLKTAVGKYGGKIAVGADIRDGKVAVKGWTERSPYDAFGFLSDMEKEGIRTVICTDISRDGAMRGCNRALYRALAGRFGVDLIASGGVSTLEDLTALKELGLYGAIVGKAYYTGAIDLKTALEAVR